MIKAELTYNPYLMETDITFNGQSPHINSLVEKYQDGRLQDWVKELPAIFHDEMNGYDFELEFSGTSRDFSEIEKAFRQAGVSGDQVKLFHKNELEERDSKRKRIETLLEWMENNPSRNFDYKQFRDDNEILFDGAYSVISVQGEKAEQPVIDWTPASVEVIKDIHELEDTDLTFTPVIINVDKAMLASLQGILRYLYQRADVVVQQIFFRLGDGLNRDTVYRIIKDLGIRNPHFITDFNDEKLKKYFELYPVTEYIKDSIAMFREKADEIESVLDCEKKEVEQSNTEIDEQIHVIETEISKARLADEEITTRNNIDRPADFIPAGNIVGAAIRCWRKKKTKTVDADEAQALAEELYLEIGKAYKEFATRIKSSIAETKGSIDETYKDAYSKSGIDDGFTADHINLDIVSLDTLPRFASDLLKIQTEEKVKNTGGGFFYIPPKSSDVEYITQTAFYLQKWRIHVGELIGPMIDRYLDKVLESLSVYNNRISTAYHEHLLQIIAAKNSKREDLFSQLSSEAKQVQQDSTWLVDFRQQLKAIERG